MKITDVKKKFKNTWVLAKVLKSNSLNTPVDVIPILSSKNRETIYSRMEKLPPGSKVATMYTGKVAGAFLF